MLESEATVSNKELQREKIRERYKGSNSELLEVIPGKKAADYCDDIERRVAVYVRVSTDNLQQTSSYELQKNYYEEKVSKISTQQKLLLSRQKKYTEPAEIPQVRWFIIRLRHQMSFRQFIFLLLLLRAQRQLLTQPVTQQLNKACRLLHPQQRSEG